MKLVVKIVDLISLPKLHPYYKTSFKFIFITIPNKQAKKRN